MEKCFGLQKKIQGHFCVAAAMMMILMDAVIFTFLF